MMLKALDLYSGARDATRSLQDAGFAVTGVDIVSQPRYVGNRFICADVLLLTAEFIASFDFMWSSPPCQFHSAMKVLHNAKPHLNLIPAARVLLKASGKPRVIENVEARANG
jgi:DNA (cytosine-5)-methyltransferase 1